MTKTPAMPEPTQEQLDAFIARAGFRYGWGNLESWARTMAEQAVSEIAALQSRPEIDVRNTPFGKEAEKLADDYMALMSECAALRDRLAALQSAQPAAAVSDESAYNLIDRFLRNNLHDDDYADYSQALDILALRPQAVPMMEEPFLKVHKGEICYKSDADDQSYGMWCPVNWDTEHGFSDGTVFYAHHGITQRADGGEKQA